MKEPSVLDYVNSLLPWNKGKPDQPILATGTETGGGPASETPPPDEDDVRPINFRERLPKAIPWRTCVALALALYAQFILDPTPFSSTDPGANSLRQTNFQQALYTGLVFYALSAIFLIWAYFIKEFSLPALPEESAVTDPQTAGRWWIVAALVVGGVDYFFLGGNLFTPLNVTLWLAAVALFLRGIWLHEQPPAPPTPENETPAVRPSEPFSLGGFFGRWWDAALFLLFAFFVGMQPGTNIYLFGLLPLLIGLAIVALRNPQSGQSLWYWIKTFLARDSWQLKITRWMLLLVAVSAVIIFFRLYRIDGVPAEPFSDHAEKLLDVYDVTQGITHIFFERNTGREFIQFYWTMLLSNVLKTGLTFLTLKIGTALIGLLTLPFVYLLGKELGGKRVGLFALILAGVGYWLNTISRIGLRFPLYPAFAAPVLFFLMRGLRTQKRNDFILAGLFLGLGLHGYSPFRFMPFVVVAAVALYLLHRPAQGRRKQVLMMAAIVVVASFLVFLPLFRYAVDRPDMVSYRSLTRLTGDEQPFPTQDWCPVQGNNTATGVCIFASNTFKVMLMFFWDNGSIWVHSIPGRPALDIAAAVLFGFGYVLVFVRYLRERRWQDIFLLLAVPLLLMPSILSLAFPDENPSLNRTGAAGIVVFVIAGMALDGLYVALRGANPRGLRRAIPVAAVILLLGFSAAQSYDLVFHQFDTQFRAGAWNTSDMGRVIRAFIQEGNSPDNAWVIPFPYWVDTRLVGIQAGEPTKDYAINRDDLPSTVNVKGAKLFIVKKGDDAGSTDTATMDALRQLYPNGITGSFHSPLQGKDFWIYTVPDSQTPAP